MQEPTVALVTGANKGIGKEICRQLAQQGVIVFGGSRDTNRGQEAARELAAEGLAVRPVQLDVTAVDSVTAAARQVENEHGHLDLLINNSGGVAEVPVADLRADDLRAVFEVNLFGVVTVTHTMVPLLRVAPSARIVNVSSTTASLRLTDQGTDFGGNAEVRAAYSVSKTALNMLTVQYAKAFANAPELAHIEVIAVTPGYSATDLTGHRATVRPRKAPGSSSNTPERTSRLAASSVSSEQSAGRGSVRARNQTAPATWAPAQGTGNAVL